jgi:hypothetical protein
MNQFELATEEVSVYGSRDPEGGVSAASLWEVFQLMRMAVGLLPDEPLDTAGFCSTKQPEVLTV